MKNKTTFLKKLYFKWLDIKHAYYDFKYFIFNILFGKGYIKAIYKLVNFDYKSILEFQCFQLKKLCDAVEGGHEEEVSKMEKVHQMKRVIELMENKIRDDYLDRCGFDYNRIQMEFFKIKNTDFYEVKDVAPNKYSDEEHEAIYNKAEKLETKEMRELYYTLYKYSMGWWE